MARGVNTGRRNPDEFSQADLRTYRKFRDQHGRRWGADIENKTQAPCGPLALLAAPPLVCAPPVLPPSKYIRVSDTAGAELTIDYDRWLEDLDVAWEEFELFATEQATDLYKDQAADALEKMPPALARRIGRDRPLRREVVLAMRAGDPWVLGLSAARPKWADRFLPVEKPKDELSFLREEEDEAGEDSTSTVADALAAGRAEFQRLRQRAAELGLDVKGTGSKGAVTKADLEKAVAAAEQDLVGAEAGERDPSWG